MKRRIIQHVWSIFTLRYFLLSLGIFVFYIIAGKFGLSFAFVNPSATAVWAPTGIALASMLLFGYRVIPAIFIGAFVVNITTTGGIELSSLISLGNTLEAVIAVYLVRRFANGLKAFDSVLGLFRFTFYAVIVATMVSALVGVSSLLIFQRVALHDFWNVWLTWWVGDLSGNIIIAPLLLIWKIHPPRHFSLKRIVQLIFSFGIFVILSELVFTGVIPYPYLCIPFWLGIAFRFGRKGVTVATLIFALIAVVNTLAGQGPFADPTSTNQSLILLQMYVSVFALTILVVATALFELKENRHIVSSQEKRFKALIEKSFDAVVLIDPSSRISYASPSFEKIVGYSPDEIQGTIGFDLVVAEDRPDVMKKLAKLVLEPGGTVTVEYRTLRKDGKIIWVEATGTNLLFDSSVGAIVVNFRDITEKKRQEEETKYNEKRFRSLVEKTGEGIALVDKNRKVIYSSATISDLLGYTQAEYEKMDPSSLIHPDDRTMVQKKFAPIVKKHDGSISVQYRAMHKDGKYRWFDVLVTNLIEDEAVKAYVIKYRDITDQKTIEETVRREKVEDEAMLSSIGDGIIATDASGKITMVNDKASEILRVKEKDLLGKPVVTAIPMEDENAKILPTSERPITKVLSLGKKVVTSSAVSYVRKDKTKFPVHFTVTPIILDNQIVGTIEVFQDITKEKEIDKAKTEFVSLASHQLRTPLATINWYLEELIKNSSGFAEKQVSYLKEVYSASKRMVDLINALLNTSRLELGTFVVEPVETDIVEIGKQVVKDLEPKTEEKNITIQEAYQKGLPPIKADPKLLTIIVQNLLANAIKYTKEKDTIVLKATSDTDGFVISVADNGYGIPKNQQSKIFSKLFRADNARTLEPEGSGLGLYIVKSIVDVTGGKTWFESEENKGTTFYVSYPPSGMQQKAGEKQLI